MGKQKLSKRDQERYVRAVYFRVLDNALLQPSLDDAMDSEAFGRGLTPEQLWDVEKEVHARLDRTVQKAFERVHRIDFPPKREGDE